MVGFAHPGDNCRVMTSVINERIKSIFTAFGMETFFPLVEKMKSMFTVAGQSLAAGQALDCIPLQKRARF